MPRDLNFFTEIYILRSIGLLSTQNLCVLYLLKYEDDFLILVEDFIAKEIIQVPGPPVFIAFSLLRYNTQHLQL